MLSPRTLRNTRRALDSSPMTVSSPRLSSVAPGTPSRACTPSVTLTGSPHRSSLQSSPVRARLLYALFPPHFLLHLAAFLSSSMRRSLEYQVLMNYIVRLVPFFVSSVPSFFSFSSEGDFVPNLHKLSALKDSPDLQWNLDGKGKKVLLLLPALPPLPLPSFSSSSNGLLR